MQWIKRCRRGAISRSLLGLLLITAAARTAQGLRSVSSSPGRGALSDPGPPGLVLPENRDRRLGDGVRLLVSPDRRYEVALEFRDATLVLNVRRRNSRRALVKANDPMEVMWIPGRPHALVVATGPLYGTTGLLEFTGGRRWRPLLKIDDPPNRWVQLLGYDRRRMSIAYRLFRVDWPSKAGARETFHNITPGKRRGRTYAWLKIRPDRPRKRRASLGSRFGGS